MTTLPDPVVLGDPGHAGFHDALHELHNLITTAGDDGLRLPGDTAANLASANPTPAARQVLVESDTLLAKIGNGTDAYNDLPYLGARLLDSAASTTSQTGISAVTDITGLTVAFDVVSRPVEVEFTHPYLVSVTNPASPYLFIRNTSDSSTFREGGGMVSTAASQFMSGYLRALVTAPGSYSLKASVSRISGTGTITSLANVPRISASLTAMEL